MFNNLIKQVWSQVSGLDNLLLAGTDGIVVSKHHERDEDDFLAAEAANLIKEGIRFGQELGSGNMRSLTAYFDERVVLIQMVTEEYFILGIVNDPKYLGMVKYRFNLKSYEWYSAIA